ncbi:probable G-protein coupled receptor 132 [Ambystoma mexicanum]|uniref:probable G-protein coupled receptor 132 n=1 Tax=Ambystoma mexicanum TaxID=8296 RepID=UPI0037E74415
MNNSSETCSLPYNESTTPLVATYSVIFAIGLPANLLTAWLTLLQVQKKNVLAVYLFSLSLCDLMYLSTLPLWIIYIQNNHQWMWGSVACKITGFIFFNNLYISILLLCCISLDRFVAVVYSVESTCWRHQRTAICVTCGLCIAVAIIHSPVFVLSDGEQTQHQVTCFETLPMPRHIALFNYARFAVGFVLPLGVLIYTNCRISKIIRTSTSLSKQQKSKVKYLTTAVIAIFLTCFAPYHAVLLARAILFFQNPMETCWFEEKVFTSNGALLCLATANAIADPFIYVLVSENIRKDFFQALQGWRIHSFTNVKSDSNPCSELQNPVAAIT